MRSAVAIVMGCLILVAVSAPVRAQAGICGDLWVERNSIYKANGFCFKTARAISYFGNQGCMYSYESQVPLSRGERIRIEQIRSLERQYGCR
ncbi:YARHG domain-containing protein [Blastochloris viridis]|uniref:YARHG domain-containing protein n=1 Tax=Blastochloris viridis TaxID=1079 RepID=A0A0H5BFG5_BLAVI|nr:YARHG domain-containing protein [Blastochloris viridis]ALK09195.1 hypothetical protein BVIR_1410 [Blastochloris viridis]BAS00938.1 hypothetical protein BV133_3344 [Blastochloris viridis]CUU41858.1 hypothetical protein BVIRIDIS_08550 [Blastochloris viridis]